MRTGVSLLCLLLSLTACDSSGSHRAGLAAQGKTDPAAPRQSTQQISINAPPDKIWALLTNVQAWPSWDSSIPSTSTPPDVQDGTLFSYNTDGMSIHAAIREFVPDTALAWTGDVLNYHAIQTWTLAPQPDGTTLVTTSESAGGFMISYFFSQPELDQSIHFWLLNLKTAAEKP